MNSKGVCDPGCGGCHFSTTVSSSWSNNNFCVFKKRLTEARRDVEHGLGVTLDYFSTSREMQEKALGILQFKLNVLWVIADSIMLASSNIKVEDRDYMRQPK